MLRLRQALGAIRGLLTWLLFASLLLVAVLATILLPGVERRRDAVRVLARLFFRLAGLGFDSSGMEKLPSGPCIVVANHASYIDGPLLFAALPSRFGFVIKKEVSTLPLVGWLLGRLGHEFVERFNKTESARDTRRILRTAFDGNSLAFFPEGTFGSVTGLARFLGGAFVTAHRASLPVVPVVIHGSRRLLPSGAWLPVATRLAVEVLDPLPLPQPGEGDPVGLLRHEARQAILAALGEPDLDVTTSGESLIASGNGLPDSRA